MAVPDATLNHSALPLPSERWVNPDNPASPIFGARRALPPLAPSDTTDIQRGGKDAVCRALYVSGGTQITVCLADDDPNIATGQEGGPQTYPLDGGVHILPLHARRVLATGTDATKIIPLL